MEKSITETAEAELNALVDEPAAPVEAPVKPDTAEAVPPAAEATPEETEQTQEKKEPETPIDTAKVVEKKDAPAVEPAKADKAEKTYAGKNYADEFEFVHSVYEVAKALDKDKKEFRPLIDEAKKTGDYSKLEAKYKEYQAEFTRKSQEQKEKEKTLVDTPAKAEPNNTEIPITPEVAEQINAEAMRRFGETDVAQELKERGIEFPKTPEEFTELRLLERGLAKDLRETIERIGKEVQEDAKNILRSRQEAPVHNKSQIEKSKSQIEEFGKKWNITFTPEELQSILEEAQKVDSVYEDKNGAKFLRDKAIFKYFMAEKASEYLEKAIDSQKKAIEVDAKAKGAIEADQKLKENKDRSLSTISTTNIPSGKPAEKKAIDWKNPADVAHATEMDAQKFIEEFAGTSE
jgi:hypothetical protein